MKNNERTNGVEAMRFGALETFVGDSQGYRLAISTADGQRDGGDERICDVRSDGWEGGVPEAESYARLMAAAPDLHLALLALKTWMADNDVQPSLLCRNLMSKALAKVTDRATS